jgi:hypothetical protein
MSKTVDMGGYSVTLETWPCVKCGGETNHPSGKCLKCLSLPAPSDRITHDPDTCDCDNCEERRFHRDDAPDSEYQTVRCHDCNEWLDDRRDNWRVYQDSFPLHDTCRRRFPDDYDFRTERRESWRSDFTVTCPNACGAEFDIHDPALWENVKRHRCPMFPDPRDYAPDGFALGGNTCPECSGINERTKDGAGNCSRCGNYGTVPANDSVLY